MLTQLSFALSHTMEISEKTLQKKIQAMMPLSKKTDFINVVLTKPIIDLRKDSDKIALSTVIDATALGGLKGTGTIDMAGNVIYNAKEGAIYLQNIEVLNISSDSISENFKPMAKSLAQELINNALKTNPIYRLDVSKPEEKIAKATLKSIKVKDEKLLLKLKAF